MHYDRGMLAATLLLLVVTSAADGTSCYGHAYLQLLDCHSATRVLMEGVIDHETWTNELGYYDFDLVTGGYHTFHFRHAGFYSETHDFYVNLLGSTELPDVTLETRARCNPASWQLYPFSLPASSFTFPNTDGIHNPLVTYPVEWWYANFRLTGSETGKEYAVWVAFFKLPHMILMSVTDLQTGETWTADRYPAVFTAAEDKLDISISLPPYTDRWYNETCGDGLHAFEYWMDLNWLDAGVVEMYLQMRPIKPPIAVGGDGYIELGSAWTYYACQPRMHVVGRIHVPSGPLTGEDVEGYGWMDHQWGGSAAQRTSWEWLSIQLADMREIMVADLWVSGLPSASFSGGLNYYDAGCNLHVLPDYEMTTLETWTDPVSGREWAVKWRVQEPTRQIDLTIDRDYDSQVMRLGVFDLLPLCFWEGPCTVSGTIGGLPVQGTAFAEVTHPQECSVGACTVPGPEQLCILMTEEECIAEGGVFGGDCSLCDYATSEPDVINGHHLESTIVPSPSTPSAQIRFDLPHAAHVELCIYTADGRRIATLVDQVMPAGRHVVPWNGLDDDGAPVSSGTYFYSLKAGDLRESKKVTMTR